MLTKRQQIIGVLVALALVAAWWAYRYRAKHPDGFHSQAPPENIGGLISYTAPMPAQRKAARAALGATPAQREAAPGTPAQRKAAQGGTGCQAKSGFTGDQDSWPSPGVYGATASSFPYGNYAGGADMYYPTYQPANHGYWSST